MFDTRIDKPSESYRRSQVEQALWRSLYTGRDRAPVIPTVFLTRVRRLLDSDRTELFAEPTRAFGEEEPTGQGNERSYSAFDVFCLALAVELMNRGFKAGEIVFLMRWVRVSLRPIYQQIMRDPPAVRDGALARGQAGRRDHPNLPVSLSHPDSVADFKVFLIIESVEVDELAPQMKRPRPGTPIIRAAKVCHGVRSLAEEIERRGASFRSAMIVEISCLAALTAWWLPRFEPVPRGPRRSRSTTQRVA